jgi:hypothetical protein
VTHHFLNETMLVGREKQEQSFELRNVKEVLIGE